mgnify:CR=1 FL=1
MSKLLDLVTVKIDFKMSGSFLAKVTLNWQDEFEVRFCRITARPNNTLWFQPPALKEFGWAKCFAIPNQEDWRNFEEKVLTQFKKELAQQVENGVYTQDVLEKYSGDSELTITEEDYEQIDKAIEQKKNEY